MTALGENHQSSSPSNKEHDHAPASAPNGHSASHGKRIRVLQVNYRHTHGGSERLAATIGTSLDPTRFESSFAAMKGDGEIGEMLRTKGYPTVVFGRREGFDPFAIWRVWRYLKNTPVDIVQTHHVGSLVYCAPPARMLNMKVVHTEHDIHSFQRLPNELRWIKRLAALPSHYIAIDPIIRDYLVSEVHVPENRITVIRNGIDLSEFHPPIAGRPREPGKPFTVGWVSRLSPPKRPDLLIEAVSMLAEEDPAIRVRMIGGGDQLEGLQEIIRDKGLSEKVELLGPRSDIAQQLREMDCYVLCSEREGLPISLIEAMATDLPCIVSGVGGIPSLVKDDENGFLVPDFEAETLANLIRRVRQQPEQAQKVGEQAGQVVRASFDLRNTIQQYMDVFERVMRERS